MRRRSKEAYFFILPAFVVLFCIFIYPLIYSLIKSLYDVRLYQLKEGGEFVGIANFLKMLRDSDVFRAWVRTLLFMCIAVSLELILGLGIALLLNLQFRGRRFVRSAVLLPLMLTPVVLGINFKMMFNYLYGLANYSLRMLGLSPILWLSGMPWAMIACFIAEVWNQTPFVSLVLLAGLQSIPSELYEAARVDGASRWQTFREISLPLLTPAILVAVFWRSIATFRIFDVIYVMTGGGPVTYTETLSILVYRIGFRKGLLGYAAATSYGMIVFVLILAFLANRFLGLRREEL